MNKIYVLTETIGDSYDHQTYSVHAFTSKEVAEKVVNGFNDTIEYLKEFGILESKRKETDKMDIEFYGENWVIKRSQEEVDAYYVEYKKKGYGIYDSIRDNNPSYSIEEIDLIN